MGSTSILEYYPKKLPTTSSTTPFYPSTDGDFLALFITTNSKSKITYRYIYTPKSNNSPNVYPLPCDSEPSSPFPPLSKRRRPCLHVALHFRGYCCMLGDIQFQIFTIFIFRVINILGHFCSKNCQYSMNFHDNSKNKNQKYDFTFDSAHCPSFMKMGANLREGGWSAYPYLE